MSRKAVYLLIFGVVFLLTAVGLAWFGLTTDFSGPIPALSSLVLAVLSFILEIYLTSAAVRGLRNVESTAVLRRLGTFVLAIGAAMTIYAAAAFFLMNSLPPNNGSGRLPSLYLLFTGMSVMLAGTVVRNFRFR